MYCRVVNPMYCTVETQHRERREIREKTERERVQRERAERERGQREREGKGRERGRA